MIDYHWLILHHYDDGFHGVEYTHRRDCFLIRRLSIPFQQLGKCVCLERIQWLINNNNFIYTLESEVKLRSVVFTITGSDTMNE